MEKLTGLAGGGLTCCLLACARDSVAAAFLLLLLVPAEITYILESLLFHSAQGPSNSASHLSARRLSLSWITERPKCTGR